jgi:hypothetical protein
MLTRGAVALAAQPRRPENLHAGKKPLEAFRANGARDPLERLFSMTPNDYKNGENYSCKILIQTLMFDAANSGREQPSHRRPADSELLSDLPF